MARKLPHWNKPNRENKGDKKNMEEGRKTLLYIGIRGLLIYSYRDLWQKEKDKTRERNGSEKQGYVENKTLSTGNVLSREFPFQQQWLSLDLSLIPYDEKKLIKYIIVADFQYVNTIFQEVVEMQRDWLIG